MTTSTQTNILLATRDAVLDGRMAACDHFSLSTATGGCAEVLSVALDAEGRLTGFAEYCVTKCLLAFRQVGDKVRQNQIVVRVALADDAGDQAGTLRFDFSTGSDRVLTGCKVNVALFNVAYQR